MSTDTSRDTGTRTKVSAALVILSIFISTAARQVLNPLQELVKNDLGLSDNQVALLQGLALALPLILLSFPLGRLVDRWNRSKLLFAFAMGCAVGSFFTAFAHSYPVIFASRMLVGLSFAGAFMTALSLISDLSSAASRGRSIMLLYLGQVFGASACFVLAGALVGWLPTVVPSDWGLSAFAPWRLVQIVFAIAILGGAASILFLREPDRREVGNALKGDTRAALRELWSYRKILLPLLIGMATINMADAASEIWAVPVLTRAFHQQPADFGTWMGLVALFAGIGGALAGGFLSDFGQRIAGRGGILIGAILGAAISIPAAFYPLMPNVQAFAVLLAIFLVAGSCNGTAGTAAVALLMPNELRGITTAIFGTISMLVAYGLAPLLVSVTAGGLGFGADIAVPLATIDCITSVIGTIAFIVSMRDVRRKAKDIESSVSARPFQHATHA